MPELRMSSRASHQFSCVKSRNETCTFSLFKMEHKAPADAILHFTAMRKTQSGPRRKLTVLSLAAATYFMVSGGPYGMEELVQDAGYKLAIVILFVTPLIWSLPTGLMVGELAAALPAEGGFYVWVRRAMGPFWGFQEAWLSLVASIFDMAIYPTVFVLYLGRLWPAATAGPRGVAIAAAMIVVCLAWNLLGAKAVGKGSILLGTLMLSPFVLITVYAFFRHLTLGATPPAQGSFLTGILVAMWNYMGWDNASTVANEVENPQKTYPRVMLLTLAAIFLSYVIPVLAVWHLHVQADVWSTGSWASIATMVVGPWLGLALVARRDDQRVRHLQFTGDVLFPPARGDGGRRPPAQNLHSQTEERRAMGGHPCSWHRVGCVAGPEL